MIELKVNKQNAKNFNDKLKNMQKNFYLIKEIIQIRLFSKLIVIILDEFAAKSEI